MLKAFLNKINVSVNEVYLKNIDLIKTITKEIISPSTNALAIKLFADFVITFRGENYSQIRLKLKVKFSDSFNNCSK
jgi:hypothetical protein